MAAPTTNVPAPADDAAARHEPTSPSICIHCGLPVPRARRSASHAGEFCCVGCRIAYRLTASAANVNDTAGRTVSALMLRLGAGVFLAMNIMVFSGLFYGREVYDPNTPMDALSALTAYLLMALCAAVIALLGTPLAGDALDRLLAPRDRNPGASLLRGRVDANGLILVGVTAAFALSAVHTLRGRGQLYFDTAAMVLVLVTLGRTLEAAARRKAHLEADQLLRALPDQATVRDEHGTRSVRVEDVRVGDIVRVKPGQAVCVDGRIVEGIAHLRDAVLTGESRPRAVGPGDTVAASATALDGQLWIKATGPAGHRIVDQVVRLLEHARRRQPAIQRTADAIAALFVPGVVLLAAATFGGYAAAGDTTRGLMNALAVLLISCPCALGLAAPLASWTALRQAAAHGVLIDGPETLERLARLKLVAFDKTGTLTRDVMELADIEMLDDTGRTINDILALAAAVESASDHPIARTISGEATRRGIAWPPASAVKILPGAGIEATIDGHPCQLGNRRLLDAPNVAALPPAPTDPLELLLIVDGQAIARLLLREQLRDDAPPALAAVRAAGTKTALLTGDQPGPATRVARAVGIAPDLTRAGCLPEQKLDAIRDWRGRHGPVGMVGDGLNDGPVLAGADVGFAVAGATDLSRQAGHVYLLADALDRVPRTILLGRHAVRRIRWNLTWAFGYNSIGLALAAAGLLTPIFAASAMLVSSAVVIVMSRGAGAGAFASDRSPVEAPLETPQT